MGTDTRLTKLITRLNVNYKDYVQGMLKRNKKEIYDEAGMINAVMETHLFLTETGDLDDSVVDYLLLFDNPLGVVADKWCDAGTMENFPFVLDDILDKQDALQAGYKLYKD